MANKVVLLTGSCGFLMGNLVRKAIYEKQPYQFVSLDRVSDNNANSIYWNKNHIFHIADIRDKHIIDIIFQFEKPDIVIHGAAEIKDSNLYIESNVSGTQNIIDACLKHKTEKLIYISDSSVYGNSRQIFNENDFVNPISQYALSKSAGESLVKAASFKYGLKYNIIRLSNSYGPRQSSCSFIPKIVNSVLNDLQFTISEDGSNVKDWTHVFDHCSGIINILNGGADNEIYNVSSNQEFSDIEVVQKICGVLTKGFNLIKYEKDLFKQLNFEINLDSSKIKKIGWDPKFKFKDGIISYIEWLLINKWALK